jgi:mono/diheme cytochrome c family protein
MPDFRLSDAEAVALARYLAGGRVGSGEAGREYRRALAGSRGAGSAEGRQLFVAFNCAACHEHITIRPEPVAPSLDEVTHRLRPEWLRAYLGTPVPVRPFGFVPGSGGRMPDFGLAPEEADSLIAFLDRRAPRPRWPAYRPAPVSRFGAARTEALLERRYSCLGCHARNGRGGRVGPDLGGVAMRLQPDYVRALLADPQHALTGSAMPRPPLEADAADALADWLLTMPGSDSVSREYLSPIDHPVIGGGAAQPAGAAAVYVRWCAACHGSSGGGDGFNARYLEVAPARHSEGASISRRPDDTLFDGVHAGGRVLGGSPEMPAFGATLRPDEIRALVAHMRSLCRCEGPAWSRREGR